MIIPVVSSDRTSVLHSSPSGPWPDGITRWAPDLLAPDDVLEVETRTVVHDPFGDTTALLGAYLKIYEYRVRSIGIGVEGRMDYCVTYTTSIGAHEINRESATMIAGAGAGASPCAIDLADLSGIPIDHFLGSVHRVGLACAHGGDARSGIAACVWAGSGDTALEGRGTRAQACEGAGAACVLEAAVTSATAGGLGAASDVVGEAGAGVQDMCASSSGAIRG